MSTPEIWSRFSADPRDTQLAALRATDADRDAALGVLREAFADGRLTHAEHEERSGQALGLRTIGEIRDLVADLVVTLPARRSTTVRQQAEKKYQRDLRDARNGWLFVSLTTIGIWAATSFAGQGAYFFWPIFPIMGVGIGYLVTRANAESRIEDIEEKLLQKRKRRRELE